MKNALGNKLQEYQNIPFAVAESPAAALRKPKEDLELVHLKGRHHIDQLAYDVLDKQKDYL